MLYSDPAWLQRKAPPACCTCAGKLYRCVINSTLVTEQLSAPPRSPKQQTLIIKGIGPSYDSGDEWLNYPFKIGQCYHVFFFLCYNIFNFIASLVTLLLSQCPAPPLSKHSNIPDG